ncbi:MAG: CaiB/BaiF CoA transferase family protein [Alphaproteobacteria bacterium]|jgi:crotonobetainyl-CoA:carnitine CoA-transferase CaiB-like acyl-CoA transferase|nr:CoA transferase [Rhodobiaceae bacterium]RPF88725.1 MAG: CoA transferase [Rhizobiales bacterium TMED94]|tara:strand:+ start:3077 stop:4291 length:1215 start_codon:yes stop_codon:yes gene_type:complete
MLEGLKVIEMATYVAAPAAGAMLRDWGAEVIKVEPLNGCPMRRFFEGMKSNVPIEGNPIFTLDNRGKKGISINTSDEKGAKIVRELIKDADIFLTNVRPKSLESANLNHEELHKINPKLIYCSLTGYGLDGEERNRPGFDVAAYWSRSGMAHLTQRKGEEPLPIRTASGDHITAISTVSGILAAVYERTQTGKGKVVETSLLRTGIYSVSSDMALQLKFGRVPSTKKRDEQINPIFNFFKTKDDRWICLSPRAGGDYDLPKVVRALGKEDWLENKKFNTNQARRENAKEFIEEMDKAFSQHTMAEWGEKLDAQDLIWSPVQNLKEVSKDKQAIAGGAFSEVEDQDCSENYSTVSSPVKFHNSDDGPKGPAPKLGQDNFEVLKGIGINEEEINNLIDDGIVGNPQ